MDKNRQVTALIDSWPTRKALADAIGASTAQVHKWAQFNRIPAQWQLSVVRACQDVGMTEVTANWMLQSHSGQDDEVA